jgi:hypothetical protein
MFLNTFAVMNSMYDTTSKPAPAFRDDPLDGIADGLRGVMEEIDRRQAAQVGKHEPFPDHRERIPTGALQDELFRTRRDEMIDRAEFHARYTEAMTKLYDIASRKE